MDSAIYWFLRGLSLHGLPFTVIRLVISGS